MSIRLTRLSEAQREDRIGRYSDADTDELDGGKPRTNVSRLLSITSIIVALTVAGSLAIENITRRVAHTPESAPIQIAEQPTVTPVQTPVAVPVKTDETRMKFLERRLTLLERQIIMLQTQATVEQKKHVSFETKLSALETKFHAAASQAAPQTPRVMSEAPAPVSKPVRTAEAAKPNTGIMREKLTEAQPPRPAHVDHQQDMTKAAKPVNPATQVQRQSTDDIVTGSIKPASSAPPYKTTVTDLSRLVKPEVRNARTQEVLQTRFALSLNLHEDVDHVREAWTQLSAQHGDLLHRLEPRALPQGTQDGILMYRLIVGPVSNAAEAASHCAKLLTRGIKCTTSVFGGERLAMPPSPGTLIKVEVVPVPTPHTKLVSANIKALIANPPLPRAKPGK